MDYPTVAFTERAAIAWAMFNGVELRRPTPVEGQRAQKRWGTPDIPHMCAFVNGNLIDAWRLGSWQALCEGARNWKTFTGSVRAMAKRGSTLETSDE